MRLLTMSSRPSRSSRRPTRGAWLGPSVAAALLLVAGGCGSSDPASDDQPSKTQSSQDGQGSEGEAPSSDSAEPSKDLGDPVGSRKGSTSEGPAVLTIYAVSRADRLITVNFSLTLDASAAEKFQVSDFFADENYDASDGEGHSVDGVQVLDTKNAKLHQVASDGAEHCVCSRGLSAAFIAPGQTMLFTATYGAPPEDVTTVDLQVPHFGTFSDVPVQ